MYPARGGTHSSSRYTVFLVVRVGFKAVATDSEHTLMPSFSRQPVTFAIETDLFLFFLVQDRCADSTGRRSSTMESYHFVTAPTGPWIAGR